MIKRNRIVWTTISILFAACITFLLFPPMLTKYRYIVADMSGDAGKNIFTYLYHILYGKGIWFTGMNYPYGEHIMYTDAQPVLSVPLSYCKGITISQALGIMSWLIATSYFLAIIFVYKILLHFEVKPLVSLLFSGLIVCMTPQLLRTTGHFGLSYACIIPMLFYWTIKYDATPKWKYALYILLMGLVATFLHPYHSATILMWVVFYSAGYFIFSKTSFPLKVKHLLPLLVSVVLLMTITGGLIKLTDPLKDRPVAPYGMLVYRTGLQHIFISFISPVWKSFEAYANTKEILNRSREEGLAYSGLAVLITVLVSLVIWLVNTARKKTTLPVTNNFQPVWLFMAIAALLLAMGIPFIWNMEWIADYLSFLRQFRTLGRFSWIFYYIICVYGAATIYRCYTYYLVKNKPAIAYTVLTLALALWSYEASGYVESERRALEFHQKNFEIVNGTGHHQWKKFLAAHGYKAEDFQAQLLIRYSHVGSDKLWLGGEQTSLEIPIGMEVGLQLHLPMIDAIMARSSWDITKKQVKISGGPFVHKPILDEIKSNKPFLLVNEFTDVPPADERYLLAASEKIGLYNDWWVYACYPDRLRANDKKNADSINALLPFIKAGDTCIVYKGPWYVNHFDTGKATPQLFGKGAFSYVPQMYTELFNVPVIAQIRNQEYEFSCWFLLSDKNFKAPFCDLHLLDSNDKIITAIAVLTKESTDNNGLWFRAIKNFPVPPNCKRIKCMLENYTNNTYEVMDELLLRPADALIISKSASGQVMVNNHLFPQQ